MVNGNRWRHHAIDGDLVAVYIYIYLSTIDVHASNNTLVKHYIETLTIIQEVAIIKSIIMSFPCLM